MASLEGLIKQMAFILKYIIVVVTIITIGCITEAAFADNTPKYIKISQCYSIKSNDLKQLCLAQAKSDKSRCYNIKNNDIKQMCLSQ